MINFRELLSSGDILCGTMVTLASSEVVETLAHIGFDWLFVDAEHSPLSAIAVRDIIQTAGSTPCLVRIASKEKVQIQQALDAGAAGIIVPSVNTAQDAQYIVDCVKYPPNGSRGIGLSRANTYGLRFYEYLEKANQMAMHWNESRTVLALHNAMILWPIRCVGPPPLGKKSDATRRTRCVSLPHSRSQAVYP